MSLPLTVTDSAINRLKTIFSKLSNSGKFMRIAVNPGGCNGFEYKLSVETEIENSDKKFEQIDGITIVIDDASLDLLTGSTLDYKDELIGASFIITNPKAATSCGCGNSFSV